MRAKKLFFILNFVDDRLYVACHTHHARIFIFADRLRICEILFTGKIGPIIYGHRLVYAHVARLTCEDLTYRSQILANYVHHGQSSL